MSKTEKNHSGFRFVSKQLRHANVGFSLYDANAYALRGNAYFYLGQEDEALKDWK